VNAVRARLVFALSALMIAVLFTPIPIQAEETNACCNSSSFDLFLTGDSDSGSLTPFQSDLDDEKMAEVTSSVFGEVEIGTWNIEWGESGDYTSGTWTFRIPYEVVDSSGVSANATVVVKVGGSTYESSAQLPAVFLTESGELQVDVQVEEGQISNGEKVEVSFSVRSLIFSNPGSESGVKFFWGSEERAASISISFPLVSVEIREASVRGSLVFFPVRLTSGFGDKIWTGSNGGLVVQNVEISESPIVNSNEDWIDVTFVWDPSSSESGSVRTDFRLSPQDSLIIEADKVHDIDLGQDSGDNSWYPDEEPPRTGGSELEVIVDCEYDGSSMNRVTTIRLDGAISQWMRWGLDNIGNKSLGSNSWWRNLNSFSDQVGSSEKQNGRVDDSEELVLKTHLIGSKSDLKSFLSNGLMIDPEAVFGINPVEFGPMDVSFDFGSSRAFNSEMISIRVEASHEVKQNSRQTMIEDFIRPGGYEYWERVDLSFEVSTGMLAGFGGVNSDNDEIDYTHRRWIVMEILSIEEEDIQSDVDFRIEFEASNALLFSPLISAVISVFALCLAIGIGLAMTKNRSRVPSMMVVSVLGVLSLSIYWFGLPMPIVLGVVGSSVLLVFPAAIISPTNLTDGYPTDDRRVARVKCPSCGKRNKVESNVRPLRIDCNGCGSTLRLE